MPKCGKSMFARRGVAFKRVMLPDPHQGSNAMLKVRGNELVPTIVAAVVVA